MDGPAFPRSAGTIAGWKPMFASKARNHGSAIRECIDCDACVEACPVDATLAEDDVPAQWEVFTEINRVYFEQGHDAGEKMVQEFLTARA